MTAPTEAQRVALSRLVGLLADREEARAQMAELDEHGAGLDDETESYADYSEAHDAAQARLDVLDDMILDCVTEAHANAVEDLRGMREREARSARMMRDVDARRVAG